MDAQPPVDPTNPQAVTPSTVKTSLDDAHAFIRSIAWKAKTEADEKRTQARLNREMERAEKKGHTRSGDKRIDKLQSTLSTLHGRDLQVNDNVISIRAGQGSQVSGQRIRVLGAIAGVPTYLLVVATTDGTP